MKRMKAFFLALLLFMVTVVGCHFYITREATMDSAALGTLPSEEKGKLRSALVNNIDENGYPVFGSSEFMHALLKSDETGKDGYLRTVLRSLYRKKDFRK